MTKPTDTTLGKPGNSGLWYLELVGVEPNDLPTRLQDAAPNGEAATTGELVGKLWDATGEQHPLDRWEPEQLSPTVSVRRNYRWSVIAVLVGLAVLVGVAILVLPGFANRAADARADEYRAALMQLRAALPNAQSVLGISTEPEVSIEALAETATALNDLATAAASVTKLGNQALPSPVPLMPSEAIEALEPTRVALGPIGSSATAIASRIATAVDYREQLDEILVIPELPTQATAGEVNDLSVTLAEALADSLAVLGTLPDDAALAEHRASLDRLVAGFADWQVEYLDRLRMGDQVGAQRLIRELDEERATVAAALTPPLGAIRSDVDAALIDLSRRIERTLIELPG